ncbi:MAG: hypothetical protein H7Y27_08010 [Gemmatimonadaceae bacterium]|nr:hypothetical protein [Chitinophagaceae bacterium]
MVHKKFRWFFFKYFKWTIILLAFLELVELLYIGFRGTFPPADVFIKKLLLTLLYGIPVYLVFAIIFGLAFGYINWTRHKRAVANQKPL